MLPLQCLILVFVFKLQRVYRFSSKILSDPRRSRNKKRETEVKKKKKRKRKEKRNMLEFSELTTHLLNFVKYAWVMFTMQIQ
jgi:uncharacterized ion transporter superfamily protein YfcC